MPTVEAVIFDLDDTLYPERAFAFSGFAAVATAFEDQLGDPAAATERMRQLFDTDHRPRVFNAMLEDRGLPEYRDLLASMIETYRTHMPSIELYPDADEALTQLRGNYKLGLISDGPLDTQRNKIDALKLRGRLDEIIITSELGPNRGKPDPTAFKLMSERLGVEHRSCMYVADNAAKDFVAPNALGWTTVRIIRPDGIYSDVITAPGGKPACTIRELHEIPGLA
ncbi:MAG: HAD family hydrolase [Phycisphaerae bacterium]|jgi:putative hydrolase of the HAD superfamily